MKDVMKKVQFKDKEYPVIFNINVMQSIQEEYGTVEVWADKVECEGAFPDLKALIFTFREMINEAIDIENDEKGTNVPFVTDKQVGRMVSDIGALAELLKDITTQSIQNPEKNE